MCEGSYPITWAANIVAPSVLYACAGLTWSLERHPDRGPVFAFMVRGWPATDASSTFKDVCWVAAPFMLIVGGMIGAFLVEYYGLLQGAQPRVYSGCRNGVVTMSRLSLAGL